MDEFWLYDDKDSLSNVSCIFTLQKCKFEKFQDFVYNQFCKKIPKARCKLT